MRVGAGVSGFTGEDMGFPTWIVVDPDLNVVGGKIGFGSWDDVASLITPGP